MNEKEFAEFLAKEIIEPILPKPLTETREERMKREYAPIVGDCGWYITVQKDAAGKLVMKAPTTVKRVMGDMVFLEHENGKAIGWTNTKCKEIGDGYSDFFCNMSGYWRCMTMDFATAEDIEKAFPGAEYVEAETDTARRITPQETYDRQAEMRIIGAGLSRKSDMTYYREYLSKPYEEKEPQLRPDGTVRRPK